MLKINNNKYKEISSWTTLKLSLCLPGPRSQVCIVFLARLVVCKSILYKILFKLFHIGKLNRTYCTYLLVWWFNSYKLVSGGTVGPNKHPPPPSIDKCYKLVHREQWTINNNNFKRPAFFLSSILAGQCRQPTPCQLTHAAMHIAFFFIVCQVILLSVVFTPSSPSHHHRSVWLLPVISLFILTLHRGWALAYPYDWRGFVGPKKKTSVGLLQ